MGYRAALLFTFLFTFSSLVQAQDLTRAQRSLLPKLNSDVLKEMDGYAREVLSQCSPPDCQIVSLGPTNALIDSFLRYYLGELADQAIRYVPLREIRSGIEYPHIQRIVLPPVDSPIKKLLFVRTLESGVSIQVVAEALNEVIQQSGRKLELAGYFMVQHKFEDVSKTLAGDPRAHYRVGAGFTWPYTIRKLNYGRVEGSYRDIDRDYYRFKIEVARDLAYMLWNSPAPIPEIVELKEKLLRSLRKEGPAKERFKITKGESDAWENYGENYDEDSAVLRTGNWMIYYKPAGKGSEFVRELRNIERAQIDKPHRYLEGSKYKTLDKTVKLFLESPLKFKALKCATAILGTLKP